MRMKQGNIYPFEYVLEYDDATPIDLTGATVTMTMTKDGDQVPTVDKGTCTVVTASAGKVRYPWVAGETDDVGMYIIEFNITFPGGSTLSVPSNDILWLFIIPSANGGA